CFGDECKMTNPALSGGVGTHFEATVPRASLRAFLSALFKDTGSLMSGSLSVIASLLALFYNASHARMAFASFAAICALTATYRFWARKRQQRVPAMESLAMAD